jgi:hypothetical protein
MQVHDGDDMDRILLHKEHDSVRKSIYFPEAHILDYSFARFRKVQVALHGRSISSRNSKPKFAVWVS